MKNYKFNLQDQDYTIKQIQAAIAGKGYVKLKPHANLSLTITDGEFDLNVFK